MFQVFATIFFSAALLAAVGVIAAMLADDAGEIGRALGLKPLGSLPVQGRRQAARVRTATLRPQVSSPLRAAA